MDKKVLLSYIMMLFFAAIALFLVFKAIFLKHAPVARQEGYVAESAGRGDRALLEKAKELIQEGDLLRAKEALSKMLESYPNSADIQKAQEIHEDLNVKILLSRTMTKDSFIYEAAKGDSLHKLAGKFGTTPELIAKANGIRDGSLQVGKKLKIMKTRFSIAVDKSQNILTLKSGDEVVKTYRVSTGKNSCTPVGTFKITTRIVDPSWYPPTGGVIPPGDKRNVLGSRWLGLSEPSYGIHGTIEPESIGKSVTEGCVRMKNRDVEELYIIVPQGTEVTIVD